MNHNTGRRMCRGLPGRILGRWGGSLRLRLLASTLVWVLLGVLLAGWGLRALLGEHIAHQLHAQLVLHLINQLSAAVNSLPGAGIAVDENGLGDPRLHQPLSGLYWQIDRLDRPGAAPDPGQIAALRCARARCGTRRWTGARFAPTSAPCPPGGQAPTPWPPVCKPACCPTGRGAHWSFLPAACNCPRRTRRRCVPCWGSLASRCCPRWCSLP